MRLTIDIDMDNDAFGDDDAGRRHQVVEILANISQRMMFYEDMHLDVLDGNGNTVGTCKVVD